MYKEKIQIEDRKLSFYLQNHSEVFLIHNSNLELNSLDSLNQVSETVVTSTILVSIIIGSYCKSALYCYLYDNRKLFRKRPINVLILIQAIIQHLICFLMVAYYTIGLYFNITFSEHLDVVWCNIPWYAQAFGVGYRNFGSLGIAIFRLLLIKRNAWIKDKIGLMKLLSIILTISLTLSTICTIGFGMGNGPASRKQVTWNFCIGKSENFREVEHNYSLLTGKVENESEFIPEMVMVVSLLTVAIELACYVLFFEHLDDHDKAMLKKKVLQIGEVKRRRCRNAITFVGQFYGFAIEMMVFSGMIYTFRETSIISHRLGIVLFFWVEFGIVSIVEVMTSNNLRQYLPHNFHRL